MNIHDDLDHLDRLVDGGAAKDEIRSQIRLIAREIAALEADLTAFAQGHAQLKEEHAQLQQAHTKLIEEKKNRNAQAWDELVRRSNIESNYADPGY